MKYEKDLEYLRKELKNAQNIYDEAEENERESDAEMWMNRITHLEFQIDVFKNAAKADEHEAKAKAFDEIMKVFENNFGAADSLAKLRVFTEVENAYIESGGYDA